MVIIYKLIIIFIISWMYFLLELGIFWFSLEIFKILGLDYR